MLTITINNRTVTLVLGGCSDSPGAEFPWIGQIGTTFGAVLGSDNAAAIEALADAIGFAGLDNDEVCAIAKEIQNDEPGTTEESAWNQATEGSIPLNGGAEWVEADDWGFWNPDKETREKTMLALRVFDALKGDEDATLAVLKVLGFRAEVCE